MPSSFSMMKMNAKTLLNEIGDYVSDKFIHRFTPSDEPNPVYCILPDPHSPYGCESPASQIKVVGRFNDAVIIRLGGKKYAIKVEEYE